MNPTDVDNAQLDTVFPPPPDFFRHFTEANLARLEEHGSDATLPPPTGELSYLVPPTIPSESEFFMFGQRWPLDDTLPSLKEQEVEQLYPTDGFNRTKELKKLNNSLIFKYLDLIGTLATTPSKFEKDVDDIRLILVNMHHLINEFRPYQARDTLKLMLEDQIARRHQVASEITSACKELSTDLGDASELIRTRLEEAQHVVQQSTSLAQVNDTTLAVKSELASTEADSIRQALDLLNDLV
ncbi:Mediator of RNA polymerase II transcription subunit 7 [Dimargaris verticillata]|uniref:Mediator of RNA polymerase II transcription subunit 7 n=1 Tax=Dimargaris verticillata TaxID=2761393 RepID=A0A9W8AZY8_9FUNG|nr:Mediator of RNA polymerase II transcription subunit 7 [Dimargaris verticillata]